MPTIRRLSFIGLEYAFAPEKAYGMSRGGGFKRQNGLVEIETDQGVKGIGEAFGNPFVTREYFRMVEPFFAGKSVFDFDHIEARIRNALYHLGVGNQLTACLAAINVALFDAIARGFGVRVCDLIGGCARTRIPAGPTGARFDRCTTFRDAKGRVLVDARTTWALIDRASGRLARVTAEIAAPFLPDQPGGAASEPG